MDGLVWWQGRVENINDPEKAGKVQVQIYNFYELPPRGGTAKEDLPWCIPILPTTSPSLNGIGDTPQFVEGSRVLGFFVDGRHCGLVSKPYIIGTMPIAPEDENQCSISFLARGRDTVEENKVSPIVPDSSYRAEYPYNRVIQSRKGHTIELDDTDGGERIRIRHGTNNAYIEIEPSGKVTISTSNNIAIAAGGTADIHSLGDAVIKADGNLKLSSDKDMTLSAQGDIILSTPGRIFNLPTSGFAVASGTDCTFEAPGGVGITEGSLQVAGDCNIGTGFNGPLVVGGQNIMFVNGIATVGYCYGN
jgi:hypothetical protein